MRLNNPDGSQTLVDKTAEGLDFTMTFWYPEGADDGAQPIRVLGSYQASDGAGFFQAELKDGQWHGLVDNQERTAEKLMDILPWVVSEVL